MRGGLRRGAAGRARALPVLRPRERHLRYDALGVYKYLLRVPPGERVRDKHADALRVLAEHDRRRNAQLLHTLEEFLRQRGHVGATAQALYVHPNTLRQRLRRIEELTGLDARDADWLLLEVALKLSTARGGLSSCRAPPDDGIRSQREEARANHMAAVTESHMNGLDRELFEPDWFLTDEQKALRERLIEICEEKIRPLAAENDATLTFPRISLEALAEDGFLGLLLPKEWGGLGQNHVMYNVVTETLARYGDASCAMCYVMHIGAVEALKLRAHAST